MTCSVRTWRGVCLLLCGLVLSGCLPLPQSRLDEEKEPHFAAGKSRVNAMDYNGAIECFQKALEVNPQSASAHFELAWLHDQKQGDPATAIYHYQQYLRLRPGAENNQMVQTRILACKQELARTVSLGPVTQSLQREFEQLVEENKRLREEVEGWRTAAATANAARTVAAPAGPGSAAAPISARVGPTAISGQTQPAVSPAPSGRATPAPADLGKTRSHVVKAGETPTAIARKYGLKLEVLMAANPRLEPRRLRIGQTLNIPGS